MKNKKGDGRGEFQSKAKFQDKAGKKERQRVGWISFFIANSQLQFTINQFYLESCLIIYWAVDWSAQRAVDVVNQQ